MLKHLSLALISELLMSQSKWSATQGTAQASVTKLPAAGPHWHSTAVQDHGPAAPSCPAPLPAAAPGAKLWHHDVMLHPLLHSVAFRPHIFEAALPDSIKKEQQKVSPPKIQPWLFHW